MPIILDNPDEPVVKVEQSVVTVEDDYKAVTVDNINQPIDNLIVYIEGSEWTVTYFQQVLGEDSEPSGVQLDLDPVYQQYTRINNFELKVTDPLTQTFVDETSSMVVEGGATVYPYVIPNQGDHFIAEIGDSKKGLFQINTVERRTILRETCHVITYSLIAYVPSELSDNLLSKVINDLYFEKEFLLNQKNPVIAESAAVSYETLREDFRDVLSFYLGSFYNKSRKTLLVPDDSLVYDHYLIKGILSVFDTTDNKLIQFIQSFNMDQFEDITRYTIWDVVTKSDDALVPLLTKEMVNESVSRYKCLPVLQGVGFSGVNYFIHPKEEETIIDPLTESPTEIPDHHPVDFDERYIFSNEFYIDGLGKSLLEIEIWKLIRNEAIDRELLHGLCESSYGWSKKDQFYLIPFLLFLIKYTLRRP